MSLEQAYDTQACHWNKHTKLSMSLEQTYNNKHDIGTNIQHYACHWNKHTTLCMSLEQTYNTKHVIGTNIQN